MFQEEEDTIRSQHKGKGRILKWHHEVPVPHIPNVNYASQVVDLLTKYGNNIALIDAATGTSVTYSDLRTRILKTRAGLVAAGIGLGDSVMLISKNHIHFPVALFGIILSGATCVPANPSVTKDELTHLARVSQSKWVITSNNITRKVKEGFAQLGPNHLKQMWVIEDQAKGTPTLLDLMESGHVDVVKTNDCEMFNTTKTVAIMPFSSGTTGLPKGVLLSHRNLLTAFMQTQYRVSLSPKVPPSTTLIILPMYHLYGFTTLSNVINTGGKIVIQNRFSPKEYFEAIEKYQVTSAPIVPHIIKSLLKTPLVHKYDISSLQTFVSGSSPVAQSSLEHLQEKTGKIAFQAYGMTETCATVTMNIGLTGSRQESVGRIQPYFEAKVIDIETGEMLGEGEEGELCVRGPGVFLGYANNPKATTETIDLEGWLHTGDLFYFDKDDFLYITDRIKDLIKVKGYQVSPTEIENVLIKLKEVKDVAVVGVPHGSLGEAPRAWVVPTVGSTINPQALMKHVSDHLSSYKQLTGGVEVVKSIPKNHIGKILRRQLKQSYIATRSKI